jgi:hypothetical protein
MQVDNRDLLGIGPVLVGKRGDWASISRIQTTLHLAGVWSKPSVRQGGSSSLVLMIRFVSLAVAGHRARKAGAALLLLMAYSIK